MANVAIVILVALCISILGSRGEVTAQALQPITPQAAKEFVSDVEKARQGDAEAAYRVGQDLDSGRLGGVKNLKEALAYYKLAAQNGHQLAAARVAQLETELGQSQKRPDTLHSALQDTDHSQKVR
jgi:TPR repeat protein